MNRIHLNFDDRATVSPFYDVEYAMETHEEIHDISGSRRSYLWWRYTAHKI